MPVSGIIKLILSVLVPMAGAFSYMHGNFPSKGRVVIIEKRQDVVERAVLRTDKLICKMAIRQKLESAEEICTHN